MHINAKPLIFGMIALLLGGALVGCTNTALRDIQLVIAGTDAVIAALESTGSIPAPIDALVNLYMGQVTTFEADVTTILASSDTPAVKDANIAAAALKIAKLDLPPGVPSLVANSLQAVASALAAFLKNTHATAAKIAMNPMAESFAGGSAKPAKLKMSDSDKKKLAELHAKAEAQKARFPQKTLRPPNAPTN